jgi:hypothetical protein
VLTLEVYEDGGSQPDRSEADRAIARFTDAGAFQQAQ